MHSCQISSATPHHHFSATLSTHPGTYGKAQTEPNDAQYQRKFCLVCPQLMGEFVGECTYDGLHHRKLEKRVITRVGIHRVEHKQLLLTHTLAVTDFRGFFFKEHKWIDRYHLYRLKQERSSST